MSLTCQRDGCDKPLKLHSGKGRQPMYCTPKCRYAHRRILARLSGTKPSNEDRQKSSYTYQMHRYDACKEWFRYWASKPIR